MMLMNETPSSSDANFDNSLRELQEEMAGGLSRQRAIDRLRQMGLSEEEADDREAELRAQLNTFQCGARDIYQDLQAGLPRQEAIARFQALGMSAEQAGTLVDGHLSGQQNLRQETQDIVVAVCRGMEQDKGVTRFEQLGVPAALARHMLAWIVDWRAFFFREQIGVGVLGTLTGLWLLAIPYLLGHDAGVLMSIQWWAWLLLVGCVSWTIFAALQYRRLKRNSVGPGLFHLALQRVGVTSLVSKAVESGVPPAEAMVLITSTFRFLSGIYRWSVIVGIVCCLAVLGGLGVIWQRGAPLSPGIAATYVGPSVCGIVCLTRGIWGLRRFSLPRQV
jgi:hypothetical protein